LFDKFV